MTLKDTVEMMNSNDYKERFKAEYFSWLQDIEVLNQCLQNGMREH